MYQGKRVSKRSAAKLSKKSIAVIGVLALVMVAVIGGTIAFLIDQDDAITNTFTPGQVACVVNEDFSSNSATKSNVTVSNTGNTDAYIRAAIVVNWVDKDGKVYATVPDTCTYSITYGVDWSRYGDYYYYNKSVASGGTTTNLIASAAPGDNVPEGYHLQITVLASAVQSNPAQAVIDAWDFDPVTTD